MQVYLIRHGLTKLNEEKRYQGQVDEPLSEYGKSQLTKAADLSPVRVYVSPLKRARETAAILFPDAEQIVIDDLMEIDFGDFDTRQADEMWETDERFRKWVEDGCKTTPPNGEAMEDYVERNRRAFLEIIEIENAERNLTRRNTKAVQKERSGGDVQAGGDPIIIVAHGGTQRAILHALGTEKDKSYFDWFLEPANGYVLEWDGTVLAVQGTVDFRKEASCN